MKHRHCPIRSCSELGSSKKRESWWEVVLGPLGMGHAERRCQLLLPARHCLSHHHLHIHTTTSTFNANVLPFNKSGALWRTCLESQALPRPHPTQTQASDPSRMAQGNFWNITSCGSLQFCELYKLKLTAHSLPAFANTRL